LFIYVPLGMSSPPHRLFIYRASIDLPLRLCVRVGPHHWLHASTRSIYLDCALRRAWMCSIAAARACARDRWVHCIGCLMIFGESCFCVVRHDGLVGTRCASGWAEREVVMRRNERREEVSTDMRTRDTSLVHSNAAISARTFVGALPCGCAHCTLLKGERCEAAFACQVGKAMARALTEQC
jgi:hypothetical protein